jgi:hypothetical protein
MKMKKLISETVKSVPTNTFFYLHDGNDDFGVYQSGSYESGKPRAVYLLTCSTKDEASTLCGRLNSGDLTREKLWEMAEKEREANAFQEWMKREIEYERLCDEY